jgi:GT2 family glycosyltransferase
MTTSLPSVSIFIPTFNDRDDLMACLESLRRLWYPKEQMGIVIWDNDSRDDTVRDVRERFSMMKNEGWGQLLLIEWKNNEGSYIPYNLSQPHLPGGTQFILGLDADVELSQDALLHMLEASQDTSMAVVGARSVYFDQPDVTSHGAGFINRWTGRYSEKDSRVRIECDFVIGCCWLLRKTMFDQLGGFDSDYYICHWEVDYCLRAREKGFRIIYEPAAVARHKILPGGTINPERFYYLVRNKILLIKKLFPRPCKWMALSLYYAFGMPKLICTSVIEKRATYRHELMMIIKGFVDGCLNRKGKTA